MIPELGRQRQADLCQFGTSLVYRVISRTVRATEKLCLEKPTNQSTNQPNKNFVSLIVSFISKTL